jgi:hypothetical protein
MAEQTELEFKVGDDEQPASVQISEDGKAELMEENQAPETSAAEPAEDHRNEVDEYSDNVKKRIDKLTARLRETQRREQAALEYARNVQARAQQLEQQYLSTDQQRVVEAQNRIETQNVALKQIIRKAREEGDVDTETEAMQRLAMLTNEQSSIQAQAAQREAYYQQVAAQQQAAQQQAGQQQPQMQQPQMPIQQPPRQVDPRVEEWAERNPWYGRDTAMTHAAWGIHKQLIQGEGFDASSDEYYHELDRRIRDTFPQKFQSQAPTQNRPQRNVQAVAPASRSSGISNARRTVKLTPSQVAIAKKLGVPLEEYAKYVKE